MLRDEQFVIFSKKFWRAINSAIKARREAYLIEDRDVVKFMIAENKAVSIMPDTFSYKDINYESGNIVMVPLKAGSGISDGEEYLIYPASRQLTLLEQKTIALLRELLKENKR